MSAPDSRMLTCEECRLIGVEPYAVYGCRVHSFKIVAREDRGRVVPHGTYEYADAVKRVEEKRAAQ